jgi:DNA recombination protein RmuC
MGIQMSAEVVQIALLCVATIGATIAAICAILCLRKGSASNALTRETAAPIFRSETDIVRGAVQDQARWLRQELGQSLSGFQEFNLKAFSTLREGIDGQVRSFGERLDGGIKAIDDRAASISAKLNDDMAQMRTEANSNRESLRHIIEQKLDQNIGQQAEASKNLRDELGGNFHRLGSRVADSLTVSSQLQKERLENVTSALTVLTDKMEKTQESFRSTVETKLDEMRQTVNEKLQTTLEARLGESFNRVVEQLERVHKGIGEMQTLAANVGDLKNVLTNVKVRGTYGEVQLALLLEQFLSPDQFVKNASVGTNGRERVEYAIKFPADGDQVLLPIDSKFPREDYEHLQEAIAAGDSRLTTHYRRELETKIKGCAKDISTRYINPPHTLDFGILFIPTESLYAEILRQSGLFEQLQRDYRVMIAGPTNLAALLTSFQMGFKSLALQKRSNEVWHLLGAIKVEFDKYGDVVSALARQLNTASNSVENLGRRTRAMSRKLKSVEALPDQKVAEKLLGFSASDMLDGSAEEVGDNEAISVAAK